MWQQWMTCLKDGHEGAGYSMRCGLKGCWRLDPKAWEQGKGFVPYPEKSFGVLRRKASSSYLCFEEISGCRGQGNGCWGQGGLQGLKRGCLSGPDWDVVRATCPTPDFTLFQLDHPTSLWSDQGDFIVNINGEPGVQGNYFVRATLFLNENIKEWRMCFDCPLPHYLIHKNKKYKFYHLNCFFLI